MSTEHPHDPDTPLDDYVDAFAARLRDVPAEATAAPTPRRAIRRRAPLLALAVALAALIVAAAGLIGTGSSGRRLDILSEARAALSPNGSILHLKITTSSSDSIGTTSQTTEQWIADGPPRWRLVQVVPPAGAPQSRGIVFDDKGPIEGRWESAYAHGARSTYLAQRDALDVVTGYSDSGPAARPPGIFGRGGADPAADLQAALADGRAVDEGEHRVDGRTVRRLVIASTTLRGPGIDRFVYDVDPDTFVPVGGEWQFGVSEPGDHRVSFRFRVDTYERLPDTPANEKLLTITTGPNTTTTHTTQELLEREQQRLKDCASANAKHGHGHKCPRVPARGVRLLGGR